ncbi:MAG: membrane protein insertase YidC, partial [Alphaproteobacteria bacterium]|nr:membrane protein insertase YidC [Alphaproteobacteria bacterium]
ELTGYRISPGYGLATHYANTLDGTVPENAVMLCTVMDYLVMELTGRKKPLMHSSNAASLGLYRICDNTFDRDAVLRCGLDPDFLPDVGVAIIIMTILLRLLMWPLTRKSYVSMAAMQKMQPEMQRIQKLYANDKMRLQMEMMKLYQTHKTSPMSGCLPMLIQIPIFFALYKALLVSVQMRNAGFLWISDLSAMDPYFILPILMGVTMYLQQRLQSPKNKTTNGNDIAAQTQRMMRWMPILFTVMFAWMPAGLVLYWTVSNIFGIIQMQIIKKHAA